MTTPYCGSSCVRSAVNEYLPKCDYSYSCLCESETYQNAWYACIGSCSASDIQTWIQDGIEDCDVFGATWPSSALSPAAPTSTVVVVSATTVTSGSTDVVVVPSSVTITSQSGSTTVPNFFLVTVTASASSGTSSNVFATSSSGSEPPPISQSTSDGGLSTGAKAGIAVGVVGVVLLALIGAYLLWRRKNKKLGTFRDEGATIDECEPASGQQSNLFQEVKPTTATAATVTSIKHPQQLSDGTPMGGPQYTSPVSVPELQHHSKSVPTSPPQPVSPAPVYSEVAAPVPSELYTAAQQAQWHSPPPGATEVDSRAISPQPTSQSASELAHSSFTVHHELPASPEFSSSITGPDQEFSAQNNRMPATTYSGAAAGSSFSAAGDENAELKRMKAEIEAIRARKERMQEMQAIEDRERELSRMIVERELEASRR